MFTKTSNQTFKPPQFIIIYVFLRRGDGEFWTLAPWKIEFRLFFTDFFISWRWLYFEQLPKKKYNRQSFIQLWATKPHISNKEQLVLCIRWVDNDLQVHEDIGFHHIANISIDKIVNVIEPCKKCLILTSTYKFCYILSCLSTCTYHC